MIRNVIKKTWFGLIAFVLLGTILLPSIIPEVQAAPVKGFNAGRIMDDSVFTRKNSMSQSQIQSFLNSKVKTCDTNGTKTSEYGGGTRAQFGTSQGYPPPYTCLKNYVQGGKTAARIIRDASQTYSINPQVLLVLLQKEQGLVTDDWPWSIQYRSATGYGCPDTADCNSDYYGFTNQVNQAARMFRNILNQNPDWYTPYQLGNNTIYWSPTLSCGSSTVNIQNLTTVALYSYTPYRPNQAALNAGYGTGNSCSSYGNRNFYLYFTDWFGPTIYSGPDIPLAGDWNGDGEATFGIKRGNQILLDNDNDGVAEKNYYYGNAHDIPLVGDWDGNGTDTISLKRADRYFINNQNAAGTDLQFRYANPNTTAVAGDWNGNGEDTISVRMGRTFYINNSLTSGSDSKFNYGTKGSRPVTGDFNGNGRDTISMKIGDSYYINNSLTPGSDFKFSYGRSTDIPVTGDFNGNGRDTISIKIGNSFYVNNSLTPGSNYKVSFAY